MTQTPAQPVPARLFEQAHDLDDAALVAALGWPVPLPCVPGVASNLRLLADHIAIMRGARR